MSDIRCSSSHVLCHVPELVRDALSGPLLGPAELSKCFVVGMHNHGVTCYVNACIQMLQASVHAMKLLISTQYRGLLAKDQLSRAVFSTLDDLRDAARSSHRSSGASYGTMYPKQIINQLPRFHMSPYSMGDAYELLLLILDNISTAEIRVARADEYVPQIATQQRLISYSGSYNEQQFPAAHAKRILSATL